MKKGCTNIRGLHSCLGCGLVVPHFSDGVVKLTLSADADTPTIFKFDFVSSNRQGDEIGVECRCTHLHHIDMDGTRSWMGGH